jgi:hypothetical protein
MTSRYRALSQDSLQKNSYQMGKIFHANMQKCYSIRIIDLDLQEARSDTKRFFRELHALGAVCVQQSNRVRH